MKIVGRITGVDAASGVGSVQGEGDGHSVTAYLSDFAAAGIEARVGVRLIFSVGTRDGATAAVNLERYWAKPADGKPIEPGVDPVMDELIDLITTTKSRETAVRSREASAIAWERRLEAKQRELTSLELATVVRLQDVERREAEAKQRDETLAVRETAVRAAEERHCGGGS